MANEIEAIVQSLKTLQGDGDVNHAYSTVDRWNRESRTADLLALSAAIEGACDVDGAARIPYEAVADHVEEVLALTAGSDHIDALFTLLGRARVRSVQRPRPLESARSIRSRRGSVTGRPRTPCSPPSGAPGASESTPRSSRAGCTRSCCAGRRWTARRPRSDSRRA